MKKSVFFTLVLAALGMNGLYAQESSYHPLLKEGKVWHYQGQERVADPEDGQSNLVTTYFDLRLGGDTIVDGNTYFKAYRESEGSSKPDYMLWREEGQKVYVYILSNKREELMYDFSAKAGDEVSVYGDRVTMDGVDVIKVNDVARHRYKTDHS